MHKHLFLVILFILGFGIHTAFALSEEEYQDLISSSPEFKEIDGKLGKVWKEVYANLPEKDKNYNQRGQQEWEKKLRDEHAKNFIKQGMSKAEAYTKATQERINMLRIIEHNSKLDYEDILAGRSWPDYYFEDWYQKNCKKKAQ